MKIYPVQPETSEYLQDESRLRGAADEIAFPETEEDVCALLASGTPVTLQGARTGITGGAVPMFGRIINLSNMNSIGEPENGFITVAASPCHRKSPFPPTACRTSKMRRAIS